MEKKQEEKIYKQFEGLAEALSEAGLYKEEAVGAPEEIKRIKFRISILSWTIVALVVVMAFAVIGLIVDTVVFHVENNKRSNDLYEVKRVTDVLQDKHPELFQ